MHTEGVTAIDARNLMAIGVDQAERLANAVSRVEQAIVDTSRNKQLSAVEVLVFKLSYVSLGTLMAELQERGFEVTKLHHEELAKSLIKVEW